jgi:tetratricopeptide (TPR) repeat protein
VKGADAPPRAPTFEDAVRLHRSGRLDEAERVYRTVLAATPNDHRADYNLGMLLLRSGRAAEATEHLGAAAKADGKRAENWLSFVEALIASQRKLEALQVIAALRQQGLSGDRLGALEADAWPQDGFAGLGQAEVLKFAVEDPGQNVEAILQQGDALHAAGRMDDALASYEQAAGLQPDNAAAHRGVANALYALGRFEQALASYDQAFALAPNSPTTLFNRGNALRVLKRFDAAIESYEAAVALDPDMAIAHHNRALCLLHLGDLAAGFGAYEWRKRSPTFDDPRYRLDRAWAGEDLAGKTLFIYPELFQGDLIQFCRYVRMAERRGARVILAAPQNMHRLLQTLSPTIELVADDAVPPDYDVQAALMSLPMLFGTTLETLPGEVSYLAPEASRVARWKARIGSEGFRIGLVWQGSTLPYSIPLQRSFPLAALAGVSRLPDVRLISLQKHNGLDQLSRLPPDMSVETLGDDFDPGPDAFVDTAAAMACCDLVIAMDTSVAHLAGALGVRTWVALPYVADWRWLIDRPDCPWHPSLRLFRQAVRGEWAGVFADMEQALRSELGQPASTDRA